MPGNRYFKMGRHLVCIDQSLLHAIKHLGTGYSQNKLDSIGISRKAARTAIQIVARGKLGLLRRQYLTELPAYGEIGIAVHGGYKLFDFGRSEVVKIFSSGTSKSDATREISAARQISKVPHAPRFVDADSGNDWYREEYICGTHATNAEFRQGRTLIEFYPAVEECLLELVDTAAPRTVDAETHFSSLSSNSFAQHWLAAGLEEQQVNEITHYLAGLQRWLTRQDSSGMLQLVPVHGDFSLVNAIATPGGLRFIDWEGISPGGVYDDVLNFLFVERYYGRATGDFMNDVAVFLERYGEAVRSRFPELTAATEVDRTFARRQYYLERLKLLLDREASANLSTVVRKSIDMFRDFDREAGAGEVQESS